VRIHDDESISGNDRGFSSAKTLMPLVKGPEKLSKTLNLS
jgi:hypothetical protein